MIEYSYSELVEMVSQDEQEFESVQKQWPLDAQGIYSSVYPYLRDELGEQKAREIGTHLLLKIGEYGGGLQFYLPKMDSLITPVRNIEIWSLSKDGMTAKQIAKKYNLTPARVYSIIKEQIHIANQRA